MKVVAKEGSKVVRRTIADDREWWNIMTCVNVVGFSIPNLYIFKRKTKPIISYFRSCEPNVAMSWQKNGYMTTHIFLEWLQHFKANVLGGISRDNKNLLIIDGHCSHVTKRFGGCRRSPRSKSQVKVPLNLQYLPHNICHGQKF
jgi:hypothetical protein